MSSAEWWLSLSEAAEIVRAHLALGQPSAREPEIEELDHHVLRALRNIFASGEVKTILTGISPGFDGEFLLRAEVAGSEFFSINLKSNYVLLPNVGGRYEARLHSKDLDKFLAMWMPRPARSPSNLSEAAALDWLVRQVRVAERGAKPSLLRRAKNELQMPTRMFNRLWERAVEVANRPELSKGGRPPIKP